MRPNAFRKSIYANRNTSIRHDLKWKHFLKWKKAVAKPDICVLGPSQAAYHKHGPGVETGAEKLTVKHDFVDCNRVCRPFAAR